MNFQNQGDPKHRIIALGRDKGAIHYNHYTYFGDIQNGKLPTQPPALMI
jgi:hypothetical protein